MTSLSAKIACGLIGCLLLGVANARPPRGFPSAGSPFIGACPVTSGPLTLAATSPRSTGISPFLAFFDATATTDTGLTQGAQTAFQDVTYTWTFGDSGASGTGTWTYGSNPGNNSMNSATGPVAAHMYVTSGTDAPYTAMVTATDGTNTAQCKVAVTAYDPIGSNGFPGTATTCVAQSTLPVAGSGGCPAAAAVATQASFSTAVSSYIGAGKRLLLHCGDTFTDAGALIGSTKWSIDEYGSCTGSNRPIITIGASIKGIDASAEIGDGRVSNLDFECTGSGNFAIWLDNFPKINYQITLDNLNSNGCGQGYGFSQSAQNGMVNDVITGTGVSSVAAYFNFNQSNPNAANGVYTGHAINNQFYGAAIGNFFSGQDGTSSTGIETLRIGAGHYYAIENNTLLNANSSGAVLKIHEGNTNNSCQAASLGDTQCGANGGGGSTTPCVINGTPYFANTNCWTGEYTDYFEISDNSFTGRSGAQSVENAPENAFTDERLRYFVVERNYFNPIGMQSEGGRILYVSAVNETVRDNVFNMNGTSSLYPNYGVISAGRGAEPTPSGIEAYNNTFYIPTNVGSTQIGVGFTTTNSGGASGTVAAGNSFILNNMQYAASAPNTYLNNGSNNSVSNNTTTTTNNPSFTDGSTTFSLLSDFKPTANYTGGTSVPVWYDAFGVAWAPTWDLGAVHH